MVYRLLNGRQHPKSSHKGSIFTGGKSQVLKQMTTKSLSQKKSTPENYLFVRGERWNIIYTSGTGSFRSVQWNKVSEWHFWTRGRFMNGKEHWTPKLVMIHVSICGAPLQPVAGNWHAVSQEEETGPPGLTLLTLCFLELETKVSRGFPKISQSQRRPLQGLSSGWAPFSAFTFKTLLRHQAETHCMISRCVS